MSYYTEDSEDVGMDSEPGGHFSDPFAATEARSAEEATQGLRCKTTNYEYRDNRYGERQRLSAGQRSRTRRQADWDYDAAMVFIRVYKDNLHFSHTELHIQSPHIKDSMRTLLKEYPDLALGASKIVIRGKPKCFFHFRQEFVAYMNNLSDPVAYEHLKYLMNYVHEALEVESMSWDMFANPLVEGFLPGMVFEHLWMAFTPGRLVYYADGDDYVVQRLERMSLNSTTPNEEDAQWNLTVSEMAYDGQSFGRRQRTHYIHYYDFFKPFVELSVYPLKYHANDKDIFRDAINRGKKCSGLKGTHYRQYSGKADLLSPFRDQTFHGEVDYHPLRWTTVSARIMVDSPMFGAARPSQQVRLSPSYKKYKVDGSEEDSLTDDDYATFTPLIPAFSLKDKQWGFFKVTEISDVEYCEGAFDKVILPQGQKEVIHSLVQAHRNDGSGFDDLIRGKGKGIVFLLHGVAGVGKTITAESVAEQVKRPLYVISSGDLGVDAVQVEKNLTQILGRATAWDAIVLIDEADVFLEQRSPTDLQRNGLVSVFLRVLEYYEGIMFLTSNRVRQFDEAFKSRIHMAIHYPTLDSSARRELWFTFISRSTVDTAPGWLTEECLEQLASESLNGRQIKNVVRIAHALAIDAGTELRREYLNTAVQSMKMFDKVMSGDSDDETEDFASARRPQKRFRGHG